MRRAETEVGVGRQGSGLVDVCRPGVDSDVVGEVVEGDAEFVEALLEQVDVAENVKLECDFEASAEWHFAVTAIFEVGRVGNIEAKSIHLPN